MTKGCSLQRLWWTRLCHTAIQVTVQAGQLAPAEDGISQDWATVEDYDGISGVGCAPGKNY